MVARPSRPSSGKPANGLTPMKAVRMRATTWLWEPIFPAGALCVVGGHPGSAKSTVMVDIAAQVTRGMLKGDLFGKPKGVLIMSREDSLQETLVPRLTAAGADPDRVHILPVDRSFNVPDDLDQLATWIQELDLGLVVLDPFLAYVSDRRSMHGNYHWAVKALEPLAALAQSTGCTIVGVAHTSKGKKVAGIDAFIGSRGISSTARVNLVCGTLPDDGNRVIGVLQSNCGPDHVGWVFRTHSTDIGKDVKAKRWVTAQAVTWVRPAKSHEINAALQSADDPSLDARLALLLSLLEDGQPHPVDEVLVQLMTQLRRRRRTCYSVIDRAVPMLVTRTQKGRGGELRSWLTLTAAGRAALSEGGDEEDFLDDVEEVIQRLPEGTSFRPPEE